MPLILRGLEPLGTLHTPSHFRRIKDKRGPRALCTKKPWPVPYFLETRGRIKEKGSGVKNTRCRKVGGMCLCKQ